MYILNLEAGAYKVIHVHITEPSWDFQIRGAILIIVCNTYLYCHFLFLFLFLFYFLRRLQSLSAHTPSNDSSAKKFANLNGNIMLTKPNKFLSESISALQWTISCLVKKAFNIHLNLFFVYFRFIFQRPEYKQQRQCSWFVVSTILHWQWYLSDLWRARFYAKSLHFRSICQTWISIPQVYNEWKNKPCFIWITYLIWHFWSPNKVQLSYAYLCLLTWS